MKYVLFPDELNGAHDRASLGGKAAAFHALRDTGTAIPDWFVVTPRAFADSAPLSPSAPVSPHAPVSPNALVVAEIEQALAKLALNGSLVAVRSSAADEDDAEHSFAGQFESYLSVAAGQVPEKVAAVWRSAADQRVVAYRAERGLARAQTPPAVIVQRMVEADAAGVAFSADPVGGRRDLCLVSAVEGLADQLVAGRRDGDTFHVDGDGGIVGRRLANAAPSLSDRPSLSDQQVSRVAELARRMERHFGCPQDIEWALAKGVLYLLQSRAITGLPAATQRTGDTPRLWDNSNIVESYSGITTPLTFSFARTAYQGVYRQFARIMGVPGARVAGNDAIFRNMLGLVEGRVYYNLLNWYRLLMLLPGFAVNRRFMEQMMGVGRSLPADLAAEVLPDRDGDWRAKAADALRLAASLMAMVKNRVLLRRKIAAFRGRLDGALAEPSPPLAELSLEGLARLYGELEGRLLTRWDAPLINDFFCMIAFGLVGSLLRRVCGDDAEALRNRLLTGHGTMISAEPVRWIHDMAAMAAGDGELVGALAEGTPAEARAAVARRPQLDRRYRDYLKRFEGRCFAELKLESPTLREDPLPLLRAIGACAAAHETGTGPAPEDRSSPADRPSPEATLARRLEGRPMWRWLINRVGAEAGARIRDRENLRFERTRVFGRARDIFLEIGTRLHADGVIAEPRDVFYLEVDEIMGFVEGTATSARLGDMARLRRAEFASFEDAPQPPPRFQTTGAVPSSKMVAPDGNEACGNALPADQRQGIGCCSGVVRGVVRVVRDPHAATLRKGEILVAEFTDPGWVTLFSSAGGLLVERGSLLSHSAIVAREMGIPAIVSLPGITSWLNDGERIEMNGATGRVTRLEQAAEDGAAAA